MGKRSVHMKSTWLAALLLPATMLLPPAVVSAATVVPGPLHQVSGGSPFTECTVDKISSQTGTVYLGSEVEPLVVVNPADPDNIVGTWQQDRWSNGAARGLAVGVSLDGGTTWQPVVIPGLTRCAGGIFQRASDPWLSFGSDGTLHSIALTTNTGRSQPTAMLVNRSLDGGLTWGQSTRVILDTLPFFNDKEIILADPTDPEHVYAAWGRLNLSRGRGPAYFTRSTNGGETWEVARNIHDPGRFNQVLGVDFVVQPDGRLFMFFNEIFNSSGHLITLLSFKRSDDRGATWQPGSPGAFRPMQVRMLSAVDPDLGLMVRDGGLLFDMAVDPRNGHLYAVWQDGFSTGYQWPVIFFSVSRDDGSSWSTPIRVNGTPQDGPLVNRQAFLASVHVAANGMVGVSYYDFRHDDPEAGAMTDHWFTWCHPQAVDCTLSSRWQDEVRVTDSSFDLLQAPFANGLFLGDYMGLSSAGDDFITFFTQPHDLDLSSAFSRRIAVEAVVSPQGPGFWSHQAQVAVTQRGRAHESPERLATYLEDIHALHDIFDDVSDVTGLAAVLRPPRPATRTAMTRRELMTVLLNISSGRLSPFARAGNGRDVAAMVAGLLAVVSDPGADDDSSALVEDLARAINAGSLPR
jgi:hypothetical protein